MSGVHRRKPLSLSPVSPVRMRAHPYGGNCRGGVENGTGDKAGRALTHSTGDSGRAERCPALDQRHVYSCTIGLKDGQFRREPARRDPSRLPIPTARQLWTTCANGTIKRPLTGDRQANVRFHRPQVGTFPLQHDFYRLEVGFSRHGEQPRFRYAKYANSEVFEPCQGRP